jgi:AcrR family transcriptional regulator
MKKNQIQAKVKKEFHPESSIDRRSEIYQKALDLFVSKGYKATSLSMIARHLGMSKSNLYYYCPTKEGLLYEIHLGDLKKRFVPILDEAEQLSDPEERLSLLLRKFTLMCTSSPASKVMVHEISSLSKKHQIEILSIWRRGYNILQGTISELQNLGKARKLRKSFLSFIGFGMISWIVYWFDYSRQESAEELAEDVVQIFLNGLLCSSYKRV